MRVVVEEALLLVSKADAENTAKVKALRDKYGEDIGRKILENAERLTGC